MKDLPEMNVLLVCEILEVCIHVNSFSSGAVDLIPSAVLVEAVQCVENDRDDGKHVSPKDGSHAERV